MRQTIFLFGEAERGDFCLPYHCHSLGQLCELYGNPPEDSLGLHFAVQALLLKRDCIFFRVKEEGFSAEDYFKGLNYLENISAISPLLAIAIPGVGDAEIIHAIGEICVQSKSTLLVSEQDLYDYLTSF